MIATVLDLDLVGYSTITAEVEKSGGAPAVVGVNREIQNLISTGLEAVGAARDTNLVGGTGDGAILHFADARSAVRCAAALYAAASGINRDAREPLRQRWFRMGVAAGELVRESYADGQSTWAGTTIANAVRLESAAKPGELVVLETVWERLEPELQAGFGEPTEVRGKRDERYTVRRKHFQAGTPPAELIATKPDPSIHELTGMLYRLAIVLDAPPDLRVGLAQGETAFVARLMDWVQEDSDRESNLRLETVRNPALVPRTVRLPMDLSLLDELETIGQVERVYQQAGVPADRRPGENASLDVHKAALVRWAGHRPAEREPRLVAALQRVLGLEEGSSSRHHRG